MPMPLKTLSYCKYVVVRKMWPFFLYSTSGGSRILRTLYVKGLLRGNQCWLNALGFFSLQVWFLSSFCTNKLKILFLSLKMEQAV